MLGVVVSQCEHTGRGQLRAAALPPFFMWVLRIQSRLVKQSLSPTEPNRQLFRGILPLPHSAAVSPYLPSYFGYWPYIVLTDCLLIFDMLLLSRDIVRGWTPTSCQRPKWWRKTVYFLLVYPCSHRFTLQGPQLMSRNLWLPSLGSHKTHFFKLSYTRL